MTVISSQRYLDAEIVGEKIDELSDVSEITVPVVRAYLKDLEDNDLYIMIDKHHRLAAARELGIKVIFEEVEDELSSDEDIENEDGEAIAHMWHMDSHWYYINHEDEDMIGVDVW